MTAYVILRGDGSPQGEAWRPVAERSARSREQAITDAVGTRPGRWKAVPRRSWEGGDSQLPELVIVKRGITDPDLPTVVADEAIKIEPS